MKYVVLLGDGMADELIPELDNKTPLEVAITPNMDKLAANGKCGKVKTVPNGFKPGSDVANLSILGYDVKKVYTGRAPLEAASAGIKLEDTDVAYRCNMVTLDGNIMDDYSAGHITTEESHQLIEALQEKLGNDKVTFYKGISYRHLVVIKNGSEKVETTPPHDITGEVVSGEGPEGEGSEILVKLMEDSVAILEDHPVNKKRIKEGKKPANIIWLWGQGKKPVLETFKNKFGKTGGIVTAVDLLKGIGKLAEMDVPEIEGATGYLDTNYKGKVEAALKILEKDDYVYVHVEAPDETGHQGNVGLKIKAIEDFDEKVVGPMIEGLKKFGDYRILLLPDHATPIKIKTHTPNPVPFVLYDSKENDKCEIQKYSELAIEDSNYFIEEGYLLTQELFKI